MDFIGITGMYVKSQIEGPVIMPIGRVSPNAVSEYLGFVDNANNALLRVESAKSTILMENINAHIETENETRKSVIGNYGLPSV